MSKGRVIEIAGAVLAVWIASVFLAYRFAAAGSAANVSDADFVHVTQKQATDLVTRLARHDYAAARANFSHELERKLSIDDLRAGWQSMETQFGAFQSTSNVLQERQGAYLTFSVLCHFERGDARTLVSFQPDGRVVGVFVQSVKPHDD